MKFLSFLHESFWTGIKLGLLFPCVQTEPVDPSAPEPEGQSLATQQCREEEGQVGEPAEQTGNFEIVFFSLSCQCVHLLIWV